MAKKQSVQKQIMVETPQGSGQQLEQSFTEDDNVLPSPKELEEFKKVDERFIDLFIDSTRAEQTQRHFVQKSRIEIVKQDQQLEMNAQKVYLELKKRGMFYAFGSLFLFLATAALALYLDHQWFAVGFSLLSFSSVIGMFLGIYNSGDDKETSADKDSVVEIIEEDKPS